jgi:hypothetical protein
VGRWCTNADVWSLSSTQSFGGALLAAAITRTFARRETDLSADTACFTDGFGASSDKQLQWQAFVKRNQLTELAPVLFNETWRVVMGFLEPMIAPGAEDLHWPPGGPWAPS